jgi:hypothetical protein
MLVLLSTDFHRRELQWGRRVQPEGFELGQLREVHHTEPDGLASAGF